MPLIQSIPAIMTASNALQIGEAPTYATDVIGQTCYVTMPNGSTVSVRKLVKSELSNPKFRQSGHDVRIFGVSMAPTDIGGFQSCGWASDGCRGCCLNSQGQGASSVAQNSRLATKVAWFKQREWFLARLQREIRAIGIAAKAGGYLAGIRLNVFSDILYEKYLDFEQFRNLPVMFYDYSKAPLRYGFIRPNYYITFSRSEKNDSDAERILGEGGNVAVTFHDSKGGCGKAAKKQSLPKEWKGFPVIDGDKSEDRFRDPIGGVVVGLRLKARTYASRNHAIDTGFSVCSDGCEIGHGPIAYN